MLGPCHNSYEEYILHHEVSVSFCVHSTSWSQLHNQWMSHTIINVSKQSNMQLDYQMLQEKHSNNSLKL